MKTTIFAASIHPCARGDARGDAKSDTTPPPAKPVESSMPKVAAKDSPLLERQQVAGALFVFIVDMKQNRWVQKMPAETSRATVVRNGHVFQSGIDKNDAPHLISKVCASDSPDETEHARIGLTMIAAIRCHDVIVASSRPALGISSTAL